jgi:hypothetical protein
VIRIEVHLLVLILMGLKKIGLLLIQISNLIPNFRRSLVRLAFDWQHGSPGWLIGQGWVTMQVKAFRLAPGGAYGDGSNDPMLYGPTIDVTVEKGLATIFVPPLI